MKVSIPLILLLFCLFLSTCTVGGKIENIPVAKHAAGEKIYVLTKEKWRLYGEFLAIDKGTSITILADSINFSGTNQLKSPASLPTLSRIGFNSIELVRLPNIKHSMYRDGNLFRYKRLDLRYLSRYPQGINATIMKGLLQTYEQDSLWVI